MIINFKIFENNNREPEIGDYVAIKLENLYGITPKIVTDFLNSHAGRILNINYNDEYYAIKFDKEFEGDNIMYFKYYPVSENVIEYFSKNKQEVESYLASKKYNL